MTLLPIVERELRVAARRRGTYWTRAGIVFLATVVGIVTFLASLVIPVAKFGELLFWGLSGMSMIYCLVAGRQMTADCLSEEKREGTFGLLFLTDLKGYDVVLGKLFARSFNGFYGLMATVPVLAIPLLVGGMTYGEFWRMVLVLVDTFLFTLSIGMFASAVSRDYQHAMGRNFAIILLTMALPPACASALLVWHPSNPLLAELFFSCPVYAFALCADAEYAKGPQLFWSSVGVIHGLTWALIFLACRLAPHSWQDTPVPPRPESGQKRRHWRWWKEGSAETRNAFREKLLNQNAYYWLAGRPYVKPVWVWTLLVLVACWMARTAVAVGHFEATVCIAAAVLVNSSLKLWIALEAGQQLAADQKSGAFELLLSTPLKVGDILRGQLLALARQFLKPLLVVIAMELIFMLLLARPAYHPGDSGPQLVWTWMAGISVLAADAAALSIVGMASALTAKSYTQASMRTVRCILVLPWALYGMAYLLVDLFLAWSPNRESYLSWDDQLAAWFGIGILIDVFYGWTAWHRLQTDFRELALRASGPPPPGFLEVSRRRIKRGIEAIWPQPSLDGQPPRPAGPSRAVVFGVVAVLVCVCLFLINRNSSGRFPKPLIVSLGPTNTTLRIFPAQNGVLFILPDGSLWRWGKMDGSPHYARAAIPERVGTNSDWLEVNSSLNYTIGLRGDGTIWEWESSRDKPHQLNQGHDWAQIGGGNNFSVLLKRDDTLWARGDNSAGQLGNGSTSPTIWSRGGRPFITNIVQIGTNSDWKAISGGQGSSTMAVRQNGTLWIWGNVGVLSGNMVNVTSYPVPTQVCRETNWISLSGGAAAALARNRAGEFWDARFLNAPPAPTAPASVVLTRIGSGLSASNPAYGFNYGLHSTPVRYEVRSNGTLWSAPFRWSSLNPEAKAWKQIGRRHDWILVWGEFGSVMALTSNGTIWTWGNDWGHEPHSQGPSRFQMLTERAAQVFGAAPSASSSSWSAYDIQKEPRPLMRLVPGTANQMNNH